MLCIIIVRVKNVCGLAACKRRYRTYGYMAFYLCYLAKVGWCFEDGGLLVPTIFRCAVEAGLEHVIV